MNNKYQGNVNAVTEFLKKEFPFPKYEIEDKRCPDERSHQFSIDDGKNVSALIIPDDFLERDYSSKDIIHLKLGFSWIENQLRPKLNLRITLDANGEVLSEVPNK